MPKRYVPTLVPVNGAPNGANPRHKPFYTEAELPDALAHYEEIKRAVPEGYVVKLMQIDDDVKLPNGSPTVTPLSIQDVTQQPPVKP